MTEHRIELPSSTNCCHVQFLFILLFLIPLLTLLQWIVFSLFFPLLFFLCCPLERYFYTNRRVFVWVYIIILTLGMCIRIKSILSAPFTSILIKKIGQSILFSLSLLLFTFLAFNLLPVSLLSNTNQNTCKLYSAVLFCIAEIRLNCLRIVETTCCPS